MAIQTFSRYEKKYLLSKSQKERLLDKINSYLEADAYSKDGAMYSIYNIYYDTENNALISESVKKPVYKEKLRLRTYNFPVSDNDKVFLEIKKKSEGIVNKRRITLTYKEANDLIKEGRKPFYSKSDYLNNQVLNEICYMLNRYKLKENYFIAYKRLAYFYKQDPSIRITFDKHIIKRDHNIDFKSSEGQEILDSDKWLLEIKSGKAYPLWLTHALSEIKAYSVSFSKYGTAYKQEKEGI